MTTLSVRELMAKAKKRLGTKVTFEVSKENPAWLDNSIQFPRLLAEIGYVRLNQSQAMALCDSMNLEIEDLSELFNRADREWERIKLRYVKPVKRPERKAR